MFPDISISQFKRTTSERANKYKKKTRFMLIKIAEQSHSIHDQGQEFIRRKDF